MEKITLAIIGAHGAGKTTVGTAIAKSCGCIFHNELGEAMRIKRLAEDGGAHAMRAQQEFDDEVAAAELARDKEWEKSGGGFRVVETWHPGNFAYAMQRRSQTSAARVCEMRRAVAGAVVLPLRIGGAAALARLREGNSELPDGEMAKFFLTVAARAGAAAREWGANVLPPLFTECAPPAETVAAAIAALAPYNITAAK